MENRIIWYGEESKTEGQKGQKNICSAGKREGKGNWLMGQIVRIKRRKVHIFRRRIKEALTLPDRYDIILRLPEKRVCTILENGAVSVLKIQENVVGRV